MAAATIFEAAIAPIVRPDDVIDVRPEECRPWDRATEPVPMWDELVAGTAGVPRWLGSPTSAPVYYADTATDVFAGAGVAPDAAFVAAHVTAGPGISVSAEGGDLLITRTSGSGDLEFAFHGLAVPDNTDFVLTADARAAPVPGFAPHMPRLLATTAEGARLPVVSGIPRQSATLSAWVGEVNSRVRFYYRHAFAATVTLHLRVEGAGWARLRNLRFRLATDAIARTFERGVVLTNPSIHRAIDFDLAALAPAMPLRRLQGSACQDPVHNNGTIVGRSVTVRASDGLFLIKAAAE